MINGEYNVRVVPADELWDKPRVELHGVARGEEGSDFLGVDPSVQDIARMENARPFMASQAAMAECAILLADSTRAYHDSLVREAEEWLDMEAVLHPDSMNDDEFEASIAADIISRSIKLSSDKQEAE